MFLDARHVRPTSLRGFSLVELMVVIAIMAVLSAVVLARYKSFNSTILLRNLAYEIALSTREAQMLGISVQAAPAASNPFAHAYGVHFTPGTSYTLFRDLDDDNQYDTGEDVSVYRIGQGNSITSVCAGTNCAFVSLDVLFRRPEPDALFYVNGSPLSTSSVLIQAGSQDGNMRAVRIYPTGQIAVE
ncbi:prepilin-type N-terminal cleavage/methylation domain-containing protein [Candidatus Kaiserbacteria bacterium]|nr:prepilin-type N-terminal cleavage/methylation domain-containing protein [Candidatus Kaiserbacteria bacterium]